MSKAKISYGYLSIEEFERVVKPMFECADAMYGVMLSIMRYRGLSPIDVCKLRLQDVLPGGFVMRRAKTDFMGYRQLGPRCKRLLDWWVAQHTHQGAPFFRRGYLFTTPNSSHEHVQPNTLNHKFRDYMRQAGIMCQSVPDEYNPMVANPGRRLHLIRLYDLRASFLTDVAIATHGDAFAVAAAAGHTDIRSTMRYVRLAKILRESEVLRVVEKEPPVEKTVYKPYTTCSLEDLIDQRKKLSIVASTITVPVAMLP